jgi:hypothetical protein
MTIIAYTYDAGIHCLHCARKSFPILRLNPIADIETINREEVIAVYDFQETSADLPVDLGGGHLACDTCLDVIKEHYEKV